MSVFLAQGCLPIGLYRRLVPDRGRDLTEVRLRAVDKVHKPLRLRRTPRPFAQPRPRARVLFSRHAALLVRAGRVAAARSASASCPRPPAKANQSVPTCCSPSSFSPTPFLTLTAPPPPPGNAAQ